VAGQPFRIETGELTPTLKVRRSEVLVRYQSRFDALYA
jgi:long-subunit acyl-CoA synthetase (AMP-forming)